MNKTSPADSNSAQIRHLRSRVLDADDMRVLRLVALIDDLSDRGEADKLLAQVRPRLALLHPPRPLQLMRLLFMPVDPLILPPAQWRPGAVGLPRTTLRPLAALVTAALGSESEGIAARIAGRKTDDVDLIASVGETLWPLAAQALAQEPVPRGWTELSGLHPGEFAPIARPLAILLGHGPTLWRLTHAADAGSDEAIASQLLASAAEHGAHVLATMLALLLKQLPCAKDLMARADQLAQHTPGGGTAPDRALGFVLATFEQLADRQAYSSTELDYVRRAAILLESLSAQSASRPGRAARLEQARHALDQSCRQCLSLVAADLASEAADPMTENLESSALVLRRLESVGRRIGSAPFYDRTLQDTARKLADRGDLSQIEKLRLAEILIGPDAALSLLVLR